MTCNECGEQIESSKTCTFCYPLWEKRKAALMRAESGIDMRDESRIVDDIVNEHTPIYNDEVDECPCPYGSDHGGCGMEWQTSGAYYPAYCHSTRPVGYSCTIRERAGSCLICSSGVRIYANHYRDRGWV